ncbi:MAG: peptidyl-prolyl cis-trans isomerase [Thiovulaceae bacterium]|nr:peptidyl-prolyl cis-trans isomerase [Sulfurimonadaceae bacterium]MDD3817573.1 peptidyl-prolyl cis-trans isomerase [Sulfurimonadaceae bacterium]
MVRIFLPILLSVSLFAEMIEGIAVVVKGEPITLYDVKKEMALAKTDAKKASDMLIRKKLEELEIQERKINVTPTEVYEEIKLTAARNNLSVDEFYAAVRETNGLSSSELKEKMRERLLSQKLYQSIAYASMSQPSDSEIEEYYRLNKEKFSHPSGFKVMIYGAQSQERLQEKISNPMLYTPDVLTNEQELPYDRISPELASLLAKTPPQSFTPVIPDGKGGFMSFYLQEVLQAAEGSLEAQKDAIINALMAEKREQILGDYFEKLRHNAEIVVVRLPE